MKKFYRFIIKALAIFAIYAFSINSSSAQLSVFIFRGEDAVTVTEVCQGTTLALTVEVFGGTGTGQAFTWSGDTNPTYFVDLGDLVSYRNTTPAGTYNLTVNVQDDGGFTGSRSVTVIIKESPLASIVANGVTTFCDGGFVELEETNGQSNVSYQWQIDFTNISGANNATYNATQSGQFRVRVTNTETGCPANSSNISVTVNSLPAATASNDGPYCDGETINLSSGPGGMASYSWTTNATTPFVSGIQNPTIGSSNSNNSGTYTVTVEDGNGCVNSAQTEVEVYTVVDGGTIGSDQSICYNTVPNALSSVADPTGGSGIFTYQWQISTDGVSFSNIGGATELTYTPAALTQTSHYLRVATTACGSDNSNVVIITVAADLDGGTIGSDQNICYDTTPAAFTDVSSPSGGTGAWTYEWQYQPTGSSDWTSISGSNSLTYTHSAELTITTKFRRLATNDCEAAYSNEITISVFDDINGGQIEDSQTICYGGDPNEFTSAIPPTGGNGAWTYTWESKVGVADWAIIPGADAITYNVPAGLTTTTDYRRISSNLCGVGYSNTLTVSVYEDVNPGSIGANHSICYNGDPNNLTSILPASGGDGSFTYLWQHSTDQVVWNNIIGADGLSYDPPSGLTQTTYYRRSATTSCGIVFSNAITVTVYADLDGGTIGSDQNICYDTTPAPFTNVASPTGGSGVWIYEWQYQPSGSSIWTSISGSNSLAYTYSSNLIVTTKFRRSATNSCGTILSNEITVNVWEDINPGTISIVTSEVCYGESPGTIQSATEPSGGSGATTFSWERRIGAGAWEIIGGATSSTYVVPTLTQTTSFRRWASNDCGTDNSNELTITVNPLPTQFNVTGGGEYCEGTLGVDVGLSGSQIDITYTLYLNAAPSATTLAGTGNTIGFGLQTIGVYTVYAEHNTTGCNNMMTGSVSVTEIPAITSNTINADQLICSGSSPAQLTGSAPSGGDGSFTYQWERSTDGVSFSPISGATGQNYSPSALTQTTWYQRVVYSGPCLSVSNAVEIEVNQPVANNSISANQTICYDTAPAELTGSTPTGGNGLYSYQWQISTDGVSFSDIVGATNENYQPSNLTANSWYRRAVSSPPCTDNTSNIILITVSPEFSISGFSVASPLCNDSTDGEAEVNHTGGISPYTYNWAPSGQTTKKATGLSAGVEYTVTVSDNAGCPASGVNSVTLVAPAPITIDNLTVTSINDMGGCFGDATGSISVIAAGGTPNYTYTLYNDNTFIASQTGDAVTTITFTGLVASNLYRVEVTDINSCTPAEQANIVLSQPDQLIVTDVVATDALCYGETNGTITITVSGGTGPFEYSIDGEFGPWVGSNVFAVGTGEYEVWARDANGCIAEDGIVFIDEPDEILVSVGVTHITSCFGDNSGRITIEPFPGDLDDYEYTIYEFPTPAQWVSNNIFENLAAGQYYPKVRDRVTGCIAGYAGTTIVQQPAEITFDVNILNHVTGCWDSDNGRLRVQNIQGGAVGTKQVSMNMVDWFASNTIFSNLRKGQNTVYVRDTRGCISQRTVTINGPDEIEITDIDLTNNNCFGESAAFVNITAIGGTGNLYYTLYLSGSVAAGPQTNNGLFTGLADGEYVIDISDDNGCFLNTDLSVQGPAQLGVSTEVINVSCSDSGNDGTIRAQGVGGTAPYTIALYLDGVFQNQFTGVNVNTWVEFENLAGATNYHIEIDDNNGCGPVATTPLVVLVPDPLAIGIPVVVNPTCNGVASGTITVNATGGTTPYTFVLYDIGNNALQTIVDDTEAEFTGIAAANGYYVSVDDVNGCGPVLSVPFNVIEPDAIVIDPASTNITHVSCFAASDGVITLTASGGTGDLYFTITQGGLPVDGFVTQTNNGTFTGLTGGVYIIEITDDESCGPILSSELTINEPDPLNISTSITNPICPGDFGEIEALALEGTAPYTYTLETSGGDLVDTKVGNADETIVFEDLPADDYLLTLTDVNGCQSPVNFTISEPDPIVVTITFAADPTCDAEGNSAPGAITAEATGGSDDFTFYLYRDGVQVQNNATGVFGNLSSGTYHVEVFDSNNCGPVQSASQILTSPSDLAIDNINITNVLCFGQATGELEVLISNPVGTPEFTITSGNDGWQTSNVFTGLTAGDYTVRVRDDNSCIVTQAVSILQSPELNLTTVDTPPTTASDTDGSIEVNVTGGVLNYWYELFIWNDETSNWDLIDQLDDTSASQHAFSGLGIGTYRILVTDGNACEVEVNVTLTQFSIELVSTDLLCYESCDGTIKITPLGGVIGLVTWEFDGADFTAEMEANYDAENDIYINLCSGSYVVTVFDTEGNYDIKTVYLDQPDPIVVSYNVINPVCFTIGDEGIVDFTITGGTPFVDGYDITWDGGSTRGYIVNDLAEGTYSFVISDMNGCEYNVEIVQIVYPEPMVISSLHVYNLKCFGDNSGEISIWATGATETLTYKINGPTGEVVNTNGIFTDLPAGVYEIFITDANGCEHIFEDGNRIDITQPNPIEIVTLTSEIPALACHYIPAGTINMQVNGGTPDFTYLWSNGQQTLNLESPVPGNYRITVTDRNNCVETKIINIPGPLKPEFDDLVSIAKCRYAPGGNDGTIEINAVISGGNGDVSDYSIDWYSNSVTLANFIKTTGIPESITNLNSGDYVAVSSYPMFGSGEGFCYDTLYYTVAYNPANLFKLRITENNDVHCYGGDAALRMQVIEGTVDLFNSTIRWINETDRDTVWNGLETYTLLNVNGNKNVRLIVRSELGCLEDTSMFVEVYPKIGPFLDRAIHPFFAQSDLITFNNDSTVISVLSDTEYPLEIYTQNPDYTLTYSWNPVDFFDPSNEKTSTIIFPTGVYESFLTGQIENTLTGKNEQYIPLVASVQSEYSCIETINLKARILDRVKTSNVFSPNDDGINDIWKVPYSDIFPNLEIKIFNRWGAQVWTAKGSEAIKGWDGKNRNGKPLPFGTYYYVINFNVDGTSKWKPISGSVTIIR
jgi:large repetitive protein